MTERERQLFVRRNEVRRRLGLGDIVRYTGPALVNGMIERVQIGTQEVAKLDAWIRDRHKRGRDIRWIAIQTGLSVAHLYRVIYPPKPRKRVPLAGTMTGRNAIIYALRQGTSQTYGQIAERFGFSRENARQICNRWDLAAHFGKAPRESEYSPDDWAWRNRIREDPDNLPRGVWI